MTEIRRCPQCGTELPADAPDGVCPKCLLGLALESGFHEHARRFKCPHCGNGIQLVEPSPREVTCQNCGSSFHVEPAATSDYRPDALPSTIGKFQVLE